MKTYLLKPLMIAMTFVLANLFLAGNILSQTATITASGPWPVPTGVTKVTVLAWGGGGAGGGCVASNGNRGGGGAGGTFTLASGVTATPASIPVTIGGGGLGVSGAAGGIGGLTTFGSTTAVTAIGGGGGGVGGTGGNSNGGGAPTAVGITWNGGAGASGSGMGGGFSGGGGGGAGNGSFGIGASGINGGAGGAGGTPSFPGGAGANGITAGGNGISATLLSGAGSGGLNGSPVNAARTGGNGFRGQVVVRWISISAGSIAACYPTAIAAQAAALAATTATDDGACAGGVTKVATTSGTCSAVVTVTATNACGMESVVSYNTSIDNTAPVITQGSIAPAYATVAAAEAAALAATSATDGCSSVNYSASTVGTCNAEVTVTATDACGNSSSTAYYTSIDGTPPTAVCQDITLQLDANGDAALTPNPLVFYNYSCDRNTSGFTNVSQTFVAPYSGYITSVGAGIGLNGTPVSYGTVISTPLQTVNYGVLSYSGRCCYSICSAGNNMAYLTLPTPFYVTAGESVTIAFSGSSGEKHYQDGILRMYITGFSAAAEAIDGGSTDDCGIGGLSASQTTFDCSDLGLNIVTLTVTDNNGNTNTCNATVTIENNLSPVLTPGSIGACYTTSGAAEAAAIAATIATDNCPGVTFAAATSGTCNAVVTVTATDASGNSASTAYNTRIDNTDPVITPGSIGACYPTAAAAEAAALSVTSATDNCVGTITYGASTSGTCNAVVTVTATDGCGNESSTTYNTRIDNTDPVITPGSIGTCYPTAAAAEAAALSVTSATDNCVGTITYGVSTSGTCSAVVTVTATDGCGNESSTTYNTRIDNTDPLITPGSIGACYPTAAAAEAAALSVTSATDNCIGTITYGASTSGTCSAVVTVTATDGCGNESSTTYNTRIDNTDPVITPGSIGACYPTAAAAEAAALSVTSATDNCVGTITYGASTSGTCSAVVTVTATDGCGNESSTIYNTRIDNTDPVITPGSIGACYPTAAAAEAAALLATSATDNCVGTITYGASTSGTCSAVVTVTATDGCGNESSTTYNTRIDNTDPVITPGSIGACYPTAAAAEAAALLATSATDNCVGTITYGASTSGTCNAVVTVTATDGCGNESSTTYNTRIDNTDPVITPGSIGACYPTAAAAEAAALLATSATDNCVGTITYGASTSGTCSAVVTVTATDGCGNESSTTYNTRIDNTDPVITPGSIGTCYPTAAAAEAAALLATSATDNCIGTITYGVSTSGTCSAVVTVTATDGCGNESTTTYNTRIDNTDPVITPGSIGACYPTAAAAEAAALSVTSATDNCVGTITYGASTSGTCSAVVTVTATDGCGNESSTTYNTRIDNTDPVITPGSIGACYPTAAAAEAAALSVTSATDNCVGTITYGVSTSGTCSAVVTVTATDGCGNESSTTYNTRIDNTDPVITPGSIGTCYPTPAAAEAAALLATSATDNCVGTITYGASTSGTCSAVVTVTATDGCGNESSTTYNTRIDNTDPVITPGSIGACYPTAAAAEAAALSVTSATDNCVGTITYGASTSGTCSAVVTVTATDGCGNESSTIYNTRIDNTDPVITPGSIGACYPTAAAAEAAALSVTSATDNCVGTITYGASTSGTCSAVVTVTATDGCSNESSTTYNTRIDNTAPTIDNTNTDDLTLECDGTSDPGGAIDDWLAINAGASASDACGSVTWSNDYVMVGGCGATGSALVTFTATDVCGNQTTTQATVTIEDTTNPTAICQNAEVTLDGTGNASITDGDIDNGSNDACGGVSLSLDQYDFNCSGDHTVTLTVTDDCGNTSQCTATVTVNNAPTTSTLTVTPSTQQYSDAVTFTVTITPGATVCEQAAVGATFYVGAQNMGSALFVPSGSNLVATLEDVCLLEGVVGQMSPGNKTVSAVITGIDPDFVVSQPANVQLTITKENVDDLAYNGQYYFSTSSPTSCTGTVTLSGYVEDINDTPVDCRGDIRNADMSFWRNSVGGTQLGDTEPVGLIDPNVTTDGIAVTDFVGSLTNCNADDGGETYDVYLSVDNYYTGQTTGPVIITLAKPGPDYVTGGGYIELENSAGSYAGDDDSHMNFGFHMKLNPSGNNLQGKINVIFRRTINDVEHTFQMKSNKINSMIVEETTDYRIAHISTKANLQDVTNPSNPISIAGNLNIALDAWDKKDETSGDFDKISVTLTGSGGNAGLWFSSNWSGNSTVAQFLDGGQIHVKENGNQGFAVPQDNYGNGTESEEHAVVNVIANEAVAYNHLLHSNPNPFNHMASIHFDLNATENVSLRIYDNMGQLITTLVEGSLNAGHHTYTFDGSNQSDGLYIYTLTTGKKVESGRMMLVR